MRKIAIVQPNYLPWRGFFDLLHDVDLFVFLDDVQYTVRDWRNRNRVKTRDGGTTWLTVPTVGGRNQLIKEVRIDRSQAWSRKHLATLEHNYAGTKYFSDYSEILRGVYDQDHALLAELDIALTRRLAGCLGLDCDFVTASSLPCPGTKDEKLINIVKHLQGDLYLSGPTARAYLREELWEGAGIEVAYKDYSGYPEYRQISEPFDPAVSIIDLLFMTGPEAPEYIWGKFRHA